MIIQFSVCHNLLQQRARNSFRHRKYQRRDAVKCHDTVVEKSNLFFSFALD